MPKKAEGELIPITEPMEVDDVLIVTVGTALFFLAFLVLLPFHSSLEHAGRGRWPWIALAGGLLGLLGIWYCRRRQVRIRQRAQEREAAASPDAAQA